MGAAHKDLMMTTMVSMINY